MHHIKSKREYDLLGRIWDDVQKFTEKNLTDCRVVHNDSLVNFISANCKSSISYVKREKEKSFVWGQVIGIIIGLSFGIAMAIILFYYCAHQ